MTTKNIIIRHHNRNISGRFICHKKINEIYTNSKLKIFQDEGHGFSDIGAEKAINIIMNFIHKEEYDKKYKITP